MKEYFFVLCISNELEDFDLGTVYKAQQDKQGEQASYFRVWNKYDEDYLYPMRMFEKLNLSKDAEQVLLQAS